MTLCGAHYAGEAGSEDCLLVHLPRLKVERDQARDTLRDEIAHSITSAAGDGRTITDPYKAAEYATNMLTVYRTDLLAKLARLFGDDESIPSQGSEDTSG